MLTDAPGIGETALARSVAGLDFVGIVASGLFLWVVLVLAFYFRRRLDYRGLQSAPQRSVRVSEARLYDRYRFLITALEKAGLERKWHETPEEYSRRAAEITDESAIERLGEIYRHSRFRDAVPAALVEEFDDLELQALAAARRLAEARTVNR